MDHSCKVSVIVPIFNMELYLADCLKSIQEQTLREIEIICINDGSSDASQRILEEHAAADARIVIISRENRGVAYSRNEGMAAARGQYIAFMDPDDYYPAPDILEYLYTKAEENGVLISGGERSFFSPEEPTPSQAYPPRYAAYIFQREGVMPFAEYQFDYGFTQYLYDRKMLLDNKITFPPYSRFQDPPFFVRAMIQAGKFYAAKRIAYAHRIDYKSNTWSDEKRSHAFQGVHDVWQLAVRHKLDTLKRYVWDHLVTFIWYTKGKMTPAEREMVLSIENAIFKLDRPWWKNIIYKRRTRLNSNARLIYFLGMKKEYEKNTPAKTI